jgi:hypothetical protein
MIGFITIASAAIASLLGLAIAAGLGQQALDARAQRQPRFAPVRVRVRSRR